MGFLSKLEKSNDQYPHLLVIFVIKHCTKMPLKQIFNSLSRTHISKHDLDTNDRKESGYEH